MTIERGTIDGMVGRGHVSEEVVVIWCDAARCSARYVMLAVDCGDDGVITERAAAEGWTEDGNEDFCPDEEVCGG